MPVERPVSLPKKATERQPVYTTGRASLGVPAGEMPINLNRRGAPRIIAFAQEPKQTDEKKAKANRDRVESLRDKKMPPDKGSHKVGRPLGAEGGKKDTSPPKIDTND